ncbi:hypothetical protein KKA00_01575 [bacterium]|nr:hypothetical protein [bacterium]MBU1650884.1 hypothetical protein [bacterium]MBU1880934.1 hypothetical protein [bacterium]
MTDTVILYEDDAAISLEPISLTRPVWDLRCGIRCLSDKIISHFPNASIYGITRDYLRPASKIPLPPDNISEDVLCISGACLAGVKFTEIEKLQPGEAAVNRARIVAFRGKAPAGWQAGTFLTLEGFQIVEVSDNVCRSLQYTWDLVNAMNDENAREARQLFKLGTVDGHLMRSVTLINESEIYIGSGAQVSPQVLLDASHGPIVIDEGVKIGANSVIEGPTVIGLKSQVKPLTHIRGSCLGEQCRVGGEVSVSIIQGYTNKQHGGFLGHSFLGEWCNLGSGTETSNLKNNYTPVKVQVGDKLIDSGTLFVGLTMGDHSKTAIGTVLNTGTVVGVGCIVFGAGFPPRNIPSFHWGGAEKLTRYHLKPTIETAQQVMHRRDRALTDNDREILTWIYHNRT